MFICIYLIWNMSSRNLNIQLTSKTPLQNWSSLALAWGQTLSFLLEPSLLRAFRKKKIKSSPFCSYLWSTVSTTERQQLTQCLFTSGITLPYCQLWAHSWPNGIVAFLARNELKVDNMVMWPLMLKGIGSHYHIVNFELIPSQCLFTSGVTLPYCQLWAHS